MRSPVTSPVRAQSFFSFSQRSLQYSLQGLIRSDVPSPLWLCVPLLMLLQSYRVIFIFLQVEPQDLWMCWSPVGLTATPLSPLKCSMIDTFPVPAALFFSIAFTVSLPYLFLLSRICLHHLGEQTLTDKSSSPALCNSPASPRSGF